MSKKIDKASQRKTLKKVLNYIKKYRGLMGFSILLATLIVILTLYVPILIGRAIDGIVYGNVNFTSILQALGLVVIVVIITAAAQWLMNMINNKVTYNVVRDIRNEAFEKIEILPLKYLDSKSQGEIVSRVITDVDQFADGLLLGFTQLFTGIITILGTLGFMLSINIGITFVVVLVTPLSLFVASFIAKKTYTMFKLQSETRGEQTAFIDEIIGNQKVVKAYSHEEEAIEKFDEINKRLQKYSLRATFFSSLTNPCTRFVNSIVYAGVAITGALTVLSGRMSVGALSCFLSYANQYTKPFNEISGVVMELQNAIACAGRIFELIEEKAQVPEPANAINLNHVEGEVICENLAFSYVPKKKFIENFNIHIKPGQKVAIVGPTGCGKTTLINLLMRFYDVNDGSILVEGKDIRDVTRKSYVKAMGWYFKKHGLKKVLLEKILLWENQMLRKKKLLQQLRQLILIHLLNVYHMAMIQLLEKRGGCYHKDKNNYFVSQE